MGGSTFAKPQRPTIDFCNQEKFKTKQKKKTHKLGAKASENKELLA